MIIETSSGFPSLGYRRPAYFAFRWKGDSYFYFCEYNCRVVAAINSALYFKVSNFTYGICPVAIKYIMSRCILSQSPSLATTNTWFYFTYPFYFLSVPLLLYYRYMPSNGECPPVPTWTGKLNYICWSGDTYKVCLSGRATAKTESPK